MTDNISFYSEHAKKLSKQYNSVPFESIHKDWLSEIPTKGMVLDVGAGSGRDAEYLSQKGLSVVAVEPASNLRKLAEQNTSESIHWLSSCLPELTEVFSLQTKFDLILVSAVWMHIAPSNRERSFRKLSSLLKPSGKLVISLRHGDSPDERTMYSVSASELSTYANQFGLSYQLLSDKQQEDELGRKDVSWQTVLLTLPDDGTGAFPLIRNITINDNKSSTYKIALLRSLLRIAEGHPGAVIEQTDEHVKLPLGLVSLYWLKLYKPLLDEYSIQQSSNSTGLGFVKEKGWSKLSSYSNNDFYIGALYTDKTFIEALYQTLKDIGSTIKNMPVKYTTLPNSKEPIFHVDIHRSTKPQSTMIFDFNFLSSLGHFFIPKKMWDALTRFSVWIEPALINEWVTLMSGYSLNKQQALTKVDYLNALNWESPERTTLRVRNRVDALLKGQNVLCCWSGAKIKASSYAIDHAFPFARWPNNDLWNLLPSKSSINAKKSDKLPTNQKLIQSREFILQWWQQGWAGNENEFFTQANFALPNLPHNNQNFEDVFNAFSLQRDRIKDFQQLEDWG